MRSLMPLLRVLPVLAASALSLPLFSQTLYPDTPPDTTTADFIWNLQTNNSLNLIVDGLGTSPTYYNYQWFANNGNLTIQNTASLYFWTMQNNGTLTIGAGSRMELQNWGAWGAQANITVYNNPPDWDTTGYTLNGGTVDYGTLKSGNYVISGDLYYDLFPAAGVRSDLIGAIADGTSVTLSGGRVWEWIFTPGCSGYCSGFTTLNQTLSRNDGNLTLAASNSFVGADDDGVFTNNGTITTTGSGTVVHFDQPFQNNGTLSAGLDSTLQFDQLDNFESGALTGGTYKITGSLVYGNPGDAITSVGAGATVQLTGTHQIFETPAGYGPPNHVFGDSLQTNDGTIQVMGGATLSLPVTTTTFQNNGTIEVKGQSGSVPSTLQVNSATFQNDGSLTVDGQGWPHAQFTGNSFINGVTGTVTLKNWASFTVSQFQNSGTLTLNGGEATLGEWANLDSNGKLTGGTYIITAGGTLYYSNTANITELGAGTNLTLGGLISHTGQYDNALSSLKTIDAGASLTLLSGTYLETDPGFLNQGSLTVDGGGSRLTVDNGPLFNTGVVTVSNGGSLLVAGLDNTGTLNVDGGTADFRGGDFVNLDPSGVLSGGGTYTISNYGQMIYSGVPITSVGSGTTLRVESGGEILADHGTGPAEGWALTSNYGDVEYDGNWSIPGDFWNYGHFTIGDGGQLVLLDGSNFHNVGGGTLDLTGGMIEGGGTITGDLNQTGGTIKPGYSPGTLTIDGDYILQSGGVLEIDFENPFGGPGTGWGFLHVTGNASLDGSLELMFLSPGALAPGRYAIMDYLHLLSSSMTLIDPGQPGWTFTLNFGANELDLDIGNGAVPEPASWALVLGGVLLAVARLRRKAR